MKTNVDTTEMNEPAAAAAAALTPQSPPRAITAKELKAAADAHVALGRQITDLEELRATTSADLASRSATCDLDDKAALNEIARLQVLGVILPTRIAARENELVQSGRSLGELLGSFITTTLGPRSRALRAKASAEVRIALSKLVSDEFLLNRAVAQSDPVEAIDSIFTVYRGIFDPYLVAPECHKILGSFETLLAYEKISGVAIKQAGKIGYSEAFAKHMERQKHFLNELADAWIKNAQEAALKSSQTEAP